jgi:hypothetical protein
MTSTYIHKVKEIYVNDEENKGDTPYCTKTIRVIGENGELLNEIILFGDNKIETKERG